MRPFAHRLVLPLGMALAAAVLPPPAAAQSDVVSRQLSRVTARMAQNGYGESHTRTRGTLRQGQYTTFDLSMQQGRRYAIVGVCDQDCTDLDLILYDENGNKIDDDVADDDAPVVAVSPRWSGRFRVRVRMQTCSVNPCAFGLVVFND